MHRIFKCQNAPIKDKQLDDQANEIAHLFLLVNTTCSIDRHFQITILRFLDTLKCDFVAIFLFQKDRKMAILFIWISNFGINEKL